MQLKCSIHNIRDEYHLYRSSRLTPYGVGPSTEPDVRLFRIRLLAKLIVQQLP